MPSPYELDISHTYILSHIASFAIRLDIASHADRIVGPRDRCGLLAVETSVSSLNAHSASVLRSCRRYNANSKGSPSLLPALIVVDGFLDWLNPRAGVDYSRSQLEPFRYRARHESSHRTLSPDGYRTT
jgi:hypothetical protein